MGRVEDRRLAALGREAEARVFQAAMQMNTDDDTRVLGAYAERALEAIDAGVSLPAPRPKSARPSTGSRTSASAPGSKGGGGWTRCSRNRSPAKNAARTERGSPSGGLPSQSGIGGCAVAPSGVPLLPNKGAS